MKITEGLDLLNNFRRTAMQNCISCKSDEIAHGNDGFIYYCKDCFGTAIEGGLNVVNELDEYMECHLCSKVNTYGEYIAFTNRIYTDKIYLRVCKECFTNELEKFINGPFNIKPAKR